MTRSYNLEKFMRALATGGGMTVSGTLVAMYVAPVGMALAGIGLGVSFIATTRMSRSVKARLATYHLLAERADSDAAVVRALKGDGELGVAVYCVDGKVTACVVGHSDDDTHRLLAAQGKLKSMEEIHRVADYGHVRLIVVTQ